MKIEANNSKSKTSSFIDLYESIGNSIDLIQCCKDFFEILINHFNYYNCSVFINNKKIGLNGEKNFTNIYSEGILNYTIQGYNGEIDDVISAYSKSENVIFNIGVDALKHFHFEYDANIKTAYVVKLLNFGFIILTFNQENNYTLSHLEQYDKVFRKFSKALSISIIHKSNLILIEQQKSFKEKFKKIALIAEYTDKSIVITDKNGFIEWVNKSFTDLTEYELSDVYGKKPGELLQGEASSIETIKNIGLSIKKRENFKGEIVNYSKSGRNYWIELSMQPIFDDNNELINFIAIQTDISQRKKLESEREEAIAQSKESARIKQDFIKVISHELKTPLNSILGITDLFTKLTLSIQQSEYLEGIKISAKNLQSVINSILDFSSIESGKLTLQNVPFNLSSIIENIKISNEKIIREKNLKLDIVFDKKINDTLIGDPVRLSQIILNLMSNAIKFTSAGFVKLEVTLVSKMSNANVVEFKVIDSGCGIPKEKQLMVFESFRQVDSNINRQYEGTGLGLSISSQLVNMMGGDLKIDSEPNHGSTFSFIVGLPVYNSKKNGLDLIQYSKDVLKDKRVLLVEDNTMNQFFTKRILENWGMKIEIAENGKIGVEKANNSYFDLILMDIQMPEMDGFEATQMIRKGNEFVPIIALTAMSLHGEEESLEKKGFSDYLSKPFLPEDLQLKILKNINDKIEYKLNSESKKSITESLYSTELLLNMMNGDVNKVIEMEKLFKTQVKQLIDKLEVCILGHNYDLIAAEVHRFKASANLFQLHELKEPIRVLEKLNPVAENEDKIKSLSSFVINHLKLL